MLKNKFNLKKGFLRVKKKLSAKTSSSSGRVKRRESEGLTLGGVEDTVGLSVAHVTALGLAVVLKGAGLAEVVTAPERRKM